MHLRFQQKKAKKVSDTHPTRAGVMLSVQSKKDPSIDPHFSRLYNEYDFLGDNSETSISTK